MSSFNDLPSAADTPVRSDSPSSITHRQIATARLAQDVTLMEGYSPRASSPIFNGATSAPFKDNFKDGQLDGFTTDRDNHQVVSSPGVSALATAFRDYPSATPPSTRAEESPARLRDSSISSAGFNKTTYGSFDSRATHLIPSENPIGSTPDPEIVRRHLVQPEDVSEERARGRPQFRKDDAFSSLQLQGGDVTRSIYKWADQRTGSQRRRSFHLTKAEPEDDTENVQSIRAPGGFRRHHIRRTTQAPQVVSGIGQPSTSNAQQPPLTSNFLEFLTIYGHFGGEELQEDDEALGPGEYFSTGEDDDSLGTERESLLPGPSGQGKRYRKKPKERATKPTNSATGAMLLLLKSFVGTGVLFLPRAFSNGGMLFSSVVLIALSLVSYWCFYLLVKTRQRHEGSFGDIGGILYGKHMRMLILASIVLSQIGFVAAYLVFVSTNLQAFILSLSKCETFFNIEYLIVLQLVLFLPLSLVRDISKLGFTALVADAFILLGLLYLYGFNISTISDNGGVADIVQFNSSSWTLMIGTAIFTFEGVGLIIPIQESMKKPQQFMPVLGFCMVIITVIFISMGMIGYAAFGSATETVIILNLPQEDKFVNAVQLLYSIAILLSIPLQLFPAIRILENGLFTRSGKYNPGIKWKKNGFRFFLVMFSAAVAWGGAADLDKFVSIVGSFACVPLVYIYPPLLHYKIAETRFCRMLDVFLVTFGLFGCAYTTGLTLINWGPGSPDPSLGFCGR